MVPGISVFESVMDKDKFSTFFFTIANESPYMILRKHTIDFAGFGIWVQRVYDKPATFAAFPENLL